MRIADKWAGRMPGIGEGPDDWKLRARRAEAEAEAGRAAAVSKQLQFDAREREFARILAETTDSLSWRLTAPLRSLNHLRRRVLRRLASRR
jgi:hypothetical protein